MDGSGGASKDAPPKEGGSADALPPLFLVRGRLLPLRRMGGVIAGPCEKKQGASRIREAPASEKEEMRI
jgi:hypothetical protein